MEDPDEVARRLGSVAIEAGRLLAAVPDRAAGSVAKADGSPATAADRASERLIVKRLAQLFPDVPVVGEEGTGLTGGARAFFLVDPLDGTRDYLDGSDEFAVSVALVVEGRPVAAAIAAPGLRRAWIAGRSAWEGTLGDGADPEWRPARARRRPENGVVALVSRRHGDPETEGCLARIAIGSRRTLSSAAKFGLIASGEADLYVRCGPTMEWDTAAGDHLVHRAGGTMLGAAGRPFAYGRAGGRLVNGAFAAAGDPSILSELALPDRPSEDGRIH